MTKRSFVKKLAALVNGRVMPFTVVKASDKYISGLTNGGRAMRFKILAVPARHRR